VYLAGFLKRLLGRVDGDQGQDLVEYALILSAIALAVVALFLSSGASVTSIWSSADNLLSVASGTSPSVSAPGNGGGSGGQSGKR